MIATLSTAMTKLGTREVAGEIPDQLPDATPCFGFLADGPTPKIRETAARRLALVVPASISA